MRFEHRDTDENAADRVWRTRSGTARTMTSAARTCSQLILTRARGRLHVTLRGPETRATTAPVPPDAEFLGIRFTLGTVLRPHPAAGLVDGHVSLPVTGSGRIVLGGQDFEAPTYDNAEHFLRRLRRAGLLTRSRLTGGPTERTAQRRHRAATGLSRTAVTQIDRANAAATMLRDGHGWSPTADALGYFDQAHLAHALRRYVGHTARELRAADGTVTSFLYKIDPRPGS